jgi:prepilin-type N-terminal cleavage/methylation domain-containing protein
MEWWSNGVKGLSMKWFGHMRKSSKGFTLIELMVGVAITGIAMTAIYYTYFSQQKAYVVQEQSAALQQNLRAAMFFMEREIKMAGCNPTSLTDAGIETANPGSIRFTKDVNANGEINGAMEDVQYSLAGTNLERNGVTVAENIFTLDFTYLNGAAGILDDGGGSVTTNKSQIRSVHITLVARTQDGSRSRGLDTRIKCRNLWL